MGSAVHASHFTDKNTEARSREGISPRSKNQENRVLEKDVGLGHPDWGHPDWARLTGLELVAYCLIQLMGLKRVKIREIGRLSQRQFVVLWQSFLLEEEVGTRHPDLKELF